MASHDIDAFIASGVLAPGSRVDIAKSGVGVAVPAGAPKPDISTPEAFRNALLAAKSIGYSTGPSGDYLIALLERMGLSGQIKPKLKQVPTGGFVGTLVANGDVDLGIQQVSELSTFPGIDYVGPLPGDLQKTTVFASGIAAKARQAEAAKALVKFLTAPGSAAVFKKQGMEPA
jgi:molybdate transport system substrate-binding protein